MLVATNDINQRYLDGLGYLTNVSTRKFNLKRYGVQFCATSLDNDLILLTFALHAWDNREGATNPFTEAQMMKIMDNIKRAGSDPMAKASSTTSYVGQTSDTTSSQQGTMVTDYGMIGTQDGVNTLFRTKTGLGYKPSDPSAEPPVYNTRLYVNGVRQFYGTYYKEHDYLQGVIEILVPPVAADDLVFEYYPII